MIRGQEWLIVLLIVLIIFGARKLPELARSLGASAKEFRKGVEEGSGKGADDEVVEPDSSEPEASEKPEKPDQET